MSSAPLPIPKSYTGRVVAVRDLTERFYELRVGIDDPAFTFVAGQAMTVVLDDTRGERPRKARRSYSMSNRPSDRGHVEFCIERVPGGLASNALHDLRPGDPLAMKGPYGRFVVDEASPREILFVATGVGFGPIKAMIEDLLERGATRRMRLFFGLRYTDDLIYRDLLDGLARNHPNLEPTITLSRPAPGTWDGPVGRVTKLIDERLGPEDADRVDAYLCGSEEMLADVRARLAALGVPEARIRSEAFF